MGEIQFYWVGGNAFSWITPWVRDNAIKVELPKLADDTDNTRVENGTLYDLSVLKKEQ